MALEDYRAVMQRCARDSYCKWIPLAHVKSWRFAQGCPSIEAGKFHSYSAGGRMAIALSLLEGRSAYTEKLLEVVYKCQLCGSCDTSCKACRYIMEPLEVMRELRAKFVEDGQLLPEHMLHIENLRKEDNMMMSPKYERGRWAEGLGLKDATTEKVQYVFHAGCKFCFEEDLMKVVRNAASLLLEAGLDIGIFGKDETCCGGKAYDIGFRGEFAKYAQNNIEAWRNAGAKTVVTPCSDCYFALKRLYPPAGSQVEMVHVVELVHRLIKQGRIKLKHPVPLKVTYHDPCHLGRLGEPYMPWHGIERKIRGQIVVHEPRKPIMRGADGVYQPPREILGAIPGLGLVEMERIREYSWCCGAGGGVQEAYPDFSLWTAGERIAEAKATGAEAIVSACGWCEKNFINAIAASNEKMQVYDVLEMVRQAI